MKIQLKYYQDELEERRLFFLPIKKIYDTRQIECWFILIAPVVLVSYIIKNLLRTLWIDLIRFSDLITKTKN